MGSNAEFMQYQLQKKLEIYKGLLKEILESGTYYGDMPYVYDYIEKHKLEEDLGDTSENI